MIRPASIRRLLAAVAVACLTGVATGQQQDAVAQGAELIRGNHFADAIRLLEPLAASGGASNSEAQFLVGQAYYRLAKYDEALDNWQRALDGERQSGDRPHQARTLRSIAQMRKNQGQYAAGIEAGGQALAMYQLLGDRRNAGLTSIVLGALYDLTGDYRKAIQTYLDAVPALGAEEDAAAATLSYEMGISYKNLGDYAEAQRRYAHALDIYAALHDGENQAVVLGNLGVLYETLGQDDRAIVYNHQALELIRRAGNRRGEMIALLNLAESYWHLGDERHALDSLTQDLAVARDIGAKNEEATALKTIGDIQTARGDLAAARRDYDEAARIQNDIGDRRHEASTLIGLADLSLRERKPDESRRTSEHALALARAMGAPDSEWDALLSAAAADAAAGRTTDAVAELRESARIVNDLRAKVTFDSDKIAFVDRRQEVFERLAALLVGSGRPAEALEAAEAGRARALGDLLEQRQILGKPAMREALAKVRRATDELRPGDAAAAGTRAASLDSSLARLDADDPEFASLLTARSPTATDIAATAKRLDATLIEYLTTPTQLFVWVVGRDGSTHATTVAVGRDRLQTLTRRVRSSLAGAPAGETLNGSPLHAALRELDRVLVQPVTNWLPAAPDQPVIVIPHGPLLLLPFALLEDARGRALIERHALASSPAASIYTYTANKHRASSIRDERVLIVADPVPPSGSHAEPLPGARLEGENISRRFNRNARLLTGADATEATVKNEASGYAILHFAAHGVIVPERPLASSLLLGEGKGDDGYLRVDEIFNLDLAADLVVLSGCSTGLGQFTGDGVVGMTRAFLYAGTPSVIVSYWTVSDRTTAFLMDRFYAELVSGRTKAQALRTASLATRARYPDPRSWAAFELIGEPQ